MVHRNRGPRAKGLPKSTPLTEPAPIGRFIFGPYEFTITVTPDSPATASGSSCGCATNFPRRTIELSATNADPARSLGVAVDAIVREALKKQAGKGVRRG